MRRLWQVRRSRQLPLLESLEAWSFRFFGRLAPSFLKNVFEFKAYLEKAKIKIYPETYVSLMFFTAVLTLPVSIISMAIVYFYGFVPIIFLIPLPFYVMAGFLVVPMSKASDRASNLEREMPFASAYISVMASGGIAPYTSFRRLADVQLLPAMNGEAREIIKDVEIFGIDPLTAIERAAKENPLDIFKDFLAGYASTVIIGGDIGHGYISSTSQFLFCHRTTLNFHQGKRAAAVRTFTFASSLKNPFTSCISNLSEYTTRKSGR